MATMSIHATKITATTCKRTSTSSGARSTRARTAQVKHTPCLMHTELIACMPGDCTASDIALVGAMETKALCATLAPYNLSSCAVKYVSDGV